MLSVLQNQTGKKGVKSFKKGNGLWMRHSGTYHNVDTLKQVITVLSNIDCGFKTTGSDSDLHSKIIDLHSPGVLPNRLSYQQQNVGPLHLMNYHLHQKKEGFITTQESRIATFFTHGWRSQTQYPKFLSDAGFYYRGEKSIVHCFACYLKTNVDEWMFGETPGEAHARLKKDCQFVIANNFMVKSNGILNGHDKSRTENTSIKSQKVNVEKNNSKMIEKKSTMKLEEVEYSETDGSAAHNQLIMTDSHSPSAISQMNTSDAMNSQLGGQALNNIEFKYEQFKDVEIRLKTFTSWKYDSKQKGRDLAVAGYFYTGENDIVRCFCCDLGLAEWDPKDDPWKEHARHSPSCWFLVHNKGDSFVQNIQHEWKKIYNPKHAAFDDKESRISTFDEWRLDIEQTPENLAEAGFFYTGEEDTVRCHYCDGGLRNWEPGDDPWEEHTRWFPFCKFVIKMKGREYIETIRNQTENRQLEEDSAHQNTETRGINFKQVKDQLTQLSVKKEDIDYAIDQFLKQKKEKDLTVDWAMQVIYDSDSKKNNPFSVDNFKEEKPVEKDPMKLLETNRLLKEQLKCLRCKANDACMLFVNCGHRVTCESCANNLDFCLYCNKKVNKRMKTFLS